MPNSIENRIARRVASDAIAQGFKVSVNDGEETVLHHSVDVEAIMSALGSTEEDYLYFYKDTGNLAGQSALKLHEGKPQNFHDKVGWVHLIWGNDEDLISNNSDNEITNAILAGAMSLT